MTIYEFETQLVLAERNPNVNHLKQLPEPEAP